MADFTALKTAIQNAIKQNGNEEITGNLLQDMLLAIVTTLGEGNINNLINSLAAEVTARQQAVSAEAQARHLADSTLQEGINTVSTAITAINNAIGNGCVYAGIATPSSTPASGKVFYLALTAGTYTNYGGLEVSQGINILKNNGSTWSLDSFLGIDDAPTPSSNNLVKSDGVFNDIMTNGSAFDLTAYNNGTTYADLNAALTALNALPAAYKKDGMSMKFVLTSDNNYVECRCIADEFTTNTDKWAIADEGVYVENPEFIYVKTDAEGKILFGIKVDGEPYFGVGCPEQVKEYVEQKIADLSLDEYEDIVAFLSDYLGSDTTLKAIIDGINAQIVTKVDKEDGKSLIDAEFASSNGVVENPEFIEVEVDSEGKIIAGRTPDGSAFENIGLKTRKLEVAGNDITNSIEAITITTIKEDQEDRIEITTDLEDRVISYRDANGILHENAGIVSPNIDKMEKELSELGKGVVSIKNYHLPKYGYSNLKSETFYLNKGDWSSYSDDVVQIQKYDDTESNAAKRLSLSSFYIKSTLTPLAGGGYDRTSINPTSVELELHAGKDVVSVGDKYFAKTLWIPQMNGDAITGYTKVSATQVVDPVTSEVIGYEYNGESTEVKQVTDVPPYKVWKVTKEIEHYCVVDIDFGYYYAKSDIAMGVKFQGNSTLGAPKRNFRYTFYKNNTFAKKDKIKIGEMLRLSGFNLKANWADASLVKEPMLYRVLLSIWEDRPVHDMYPWNNTQPTTYTGATGMIKGFPIRMDIGGEFYGIQIFGLKKDEKNYMLDGDDDASGIFVSGGDAGWTVQNWEDEMGAVEPMSQSTTDALTTLMDFINSQSDYTKKNMPEHMSIKDWIDYFIFLQVFYALDNTCKNLILYSGPDKTIFYPYPYDLDLCLRLSQDGAHYDDDILTNPAWGDHTVCWKGFSDAWWDEIVNRYCELRNSVLSYDKVIKTFNSIIDNIPDSDFVLEYNKWGRGDKHALDSTLFDFKKRLEWLDSDYFKV